MEAKDTQRRDERGRLTQLGEIGITNTEISTDPD